MFRNVVTYRDASVRAQPVPRLGLDAITLGKVDALLLACVHPVMHHRGEPRALWLYDIHLLAGTLSAEEVEAFAARARHAAVAVVCAQQLRLAQTVFATPVPDGLLERLGEASGEPSASTWRLNEGGGMSSCPACVRYRRSPRECSCCAVCGSAPRVHARGLRSAR